MSGAPLFTLVIFMKVDNIFLLMFVLNFVLFFNLDKFHHIVDACVEFCFLKKQFLNLTINMQLLYFITRPAKFIQPGTISVRGTVLY